MTDLERIKEKYRNENNPDINTLIELVDGLYITLGEVSMSFTKRLEQLDDYTSVMTAYYTNMLMDETNDFKRPYIEGKLNMVKDFRKKFNELNS